MTNCKLSKGVGLQSSTNLEAMWAILFQNDIGSFMYMQHGMHKITYYYTCNGSCEPIYGESWANTLDCNEMDLCYLKCTLDFGLCFRKHIKDVMGKVHSNEDVNHS